MSQLDALTNIGKPMPTLKSDTPTLVLKNTRDAMHVNLMNAIRLNRYDSKFMKNIWEMYLVKNKPLSTGQNVLYEKILHKYRKQIKKMGINYRDILALSWKESVVSDKILNLKAFFRLTNGADGDTMELYFTFNKAKIEEIRKLVHDDDATYFNIGIDHNFGNGQKYDFTWDNKTKIWSGPFNEYLFKRLYEFALKYRIPIASEVTQFVRSMAEFGTASDWTPSVHVSNDRIYVSHITESMLPYLEKLDPADLSVRNMEEFLKMGLAADSKYDDIAVYMNALPDSNALTISSLEEVAVLKNYIKQSGRKVIFFIPELGGHRPHQPTSAIDAICACESWDTNPVLIRDTLPLDVPERANEQIARLAADGYDTLISSISLSGLAYSHTDTHGAIAKFALRGAKVICIEVT
jgi:hypothetical protein